ncbi:MAG: hypothetical protein ABEK59_03305 [Halobacteria archaeon]
MDQPNCEAITHDKAEPVLQTEDIPENSVEQNKLAEILLQETPNEKILTVTPTSFASSMYLHHHTLTAIKIEELPQEVINQLSEKTQKPINKYELIKVGKRNESGPNRSIEEYS